MERENAKNHYSTYRTGEVVAPVKTGVQHFFIVLFLKLVTYLVEAGNVMVAFIKQFRIAELVLGY